MLSTAEYIRDGASPGVQSSTFHRLSDLSARAKSPGKNSRRIRCWTLVVNGIRLPPLSALEAVRQAHFFPEHFLQPLDQPFLQPEEDAVPTSGRALQEDGHELFALVRAVVLVDRDRRRVWGQVVLRGAGA